VLAGAWPRRPTTPTAAVYEHAAPGGARVARERLGRLRAAMREAGATHHFVSTVDDLAWILNLRGADVSYNPVFLAHLLIAPDTATLFIAAAKVDASLAATLAADGVRIAPYEEAGASLSGLPESATLLLDPKRVTLGTRERIRAKVVEAINPSTLAKSRKSEAEAAHVRRAMAEDGAAMCEFYAWFEAAIADPAQRKDLTELTVDAMLTVARAKRPGYVGPSFATIAAFNANGAMPHYRATRESHASLADDGLLLIDSGRPVPRRHHRHHPDVAGRPHQRRAAPRRDPGAARHDRPVARTLPARHALADARHDRPRAALGARPRLRPRHRPRRRLLPQRPRRAAELFPGHSRRDDGDAARHDHQRRARASTGRASGACGSRTSSSRCRRPGLASEFGEFLEFETLTPVPDRRPLPRALAAARRRDRLAECVPRHGSRAPGAARSPATRSPG
jgi:hypothetical protein